MITTLEQLQALMDSKEDEHLEFKEAKNNYDFGTLIKYCAALANENGGKIILGVTDKRPRKVVDCKEFTDLERTKAGLIEKLHIRIDAEAISHPDGRVLIFHVPSRPIGMPIQYKGAYWMRAGEELVPMTPDMLKRIFDEAGPDFSAEICSKAIFSDLDLATIEAFRAMWLRKTGNKALETVSPEQLLNDAELIIDGAITYAALILFGNRKALGKYLAQAEVVFEYRSTEASGPAQQREEFRQGFLLILDELWQLINLRNDKQHYQEGFFIWDIPTFDEVVVREAILNAVSHRDYRSAGSVFVRQFPRRLEIVSPGGFPPGITTENILFKQLPRNRRIAETLAKCGLVERAGQGFNRIYEKCIRQSKLVPDFIYTDDYQVSLTLNGEIQDPQFLRFLEKVGQETLSGFNTQDFLILNLAHQGQPIKEELKPFLPTLIDKSIIEKVGQGKGTRYILSQKFYSFLGKKGVYTRKRGLDRETNKALLLKHIEDNKSEGSKFNELCQVLPALSYKQVQKLLEELKKESRIFNVGRTNAARWFPGIISGITPKT